jgi:hypothetical protein
MSRAKQDVLRRLLEQLLALRVIRPSVASSWTQVHLIPKPGTVTTAVPEHFQDINKQWRFCLDYRALNAHCSRSGWPLPVIPQMINRMANHQPKFFGLFDLTSGYHQAPVQEDSKQFTAFICFMGLYEWNRVSMGLKGAPSYFQQAMASVVLHDLLYITCELYLDDLLVFGKTWDEYMGRVKAIFERLRAHHITVNPNKVKLGYSEIEFCGHLINAQGMSFTTKKVEGIINFIKPTLKRGVKQFIGLVNYFRDHLHHLSQDIQILETLIPHYSKRQEKEEVIWTTETDQTYDRILDKVKKIPQLWYMDLTKGEIILETDACDNGIGAYLYQKQGGSTYPIMFVSKAFTESEKRWATNVKESYAIYYSIKKLDYLLRDVQFRLRTDHRNLTFINSGTGKMVEIIFIRI